MRPETTRRDPLLLNDQSRERRDDAACDCTLMSIGPPTYHQRYEEPRRCEAQFGGRWLQARGLTAHEANSPRRADPVRNLEIDGRLTLELSGDVAVCLEWMVRLAQCERLERFDQDFSWMSRYLLHNADSSHLTCVQLNSIKRSDNPSFL